MINTLDSLYKDFTYSPQLANIWEFYIEEDWESEEGISKFKVVSTNLPFPSLEQEQRNTGHHFYSGYTMPDSFSITLREDSNFSVYKYFKKWQDSVFDVRSGVFKSGNGANKIKTGAIEFGKFKLKKDSQLFKSMAINKIENLFVQAKDTAFEFAKREVTKGIPGRANSISRQVIQSGAQQLNKKIGDTIDFPDYSDLFEYVITQTFELKGLRFLGISDISLDYSNSEQLQLTVNLGVDYIEDNLEG